MKILVLTTSFPRFNGDYGGNFVLQIARNLRGDVEVLTPHIPGLKTDDSICGVRIKRFRYAFPELLYRHKGGIPVNIKKSRIALLQLPLFMLAYIVHAFFAARRNDVIHANWIPSAIAGTVTKPFHKKPVVLTERSPENLKTKNVILRNIIKVTLRRCDKVVLISSYLKEDVMNLGVRESDIEIIHNGIEMDLFRRVNREEVRRKIDVNKEDFIVLGVGNMIKRKDFKTLIETVCGMENTKLVLIGDGPEKNALEEFAKKIGSPTLFVGEIRRDELPFWYSMSDVFVSSSLSETGPNTVLEAMSCETPVITTDTGFARDIIREGVDGFIVKSSDCKGIQRLVEMLKKDEKLRIVVGKRGRERLKELKISWEESAERYRKIFLGLVENSRCAV